MKPSSLTFFVFLFWLKRLTKIKHQLFPQVLWKSEVFGKIKVFLPLKGATFWQQTCCIPAGLSQPPSTLFDMMRYQNPFGLRKFGGHLYHWGLTLTSHCYFGTVDASDRKKPIKSFKSHCGPPQPYKPAVGTSFPLSPDWGFCQPRQVHGS